MYTRRVARWLLGTLLAVIACAPGLAVAEAPAEATVDDFHQTLRQVMVEAQTLEFAGRQRVLAPKLASSFDLAYIAERVSGRHWRDWNEEQRGQMRDTFTALTVATYAARFDGYAGEAFKVTGSEPLKKQRVLVRSELLSADGDAVALDYVLHQTNGDWRIINVVAEGVSDLSIKRADYSTVLKSAGFEELMNRLDEQIDGLAAGS